MQNDENSPDLNFLPVFHIMKTTQGVIDMAKRHHLFSSRRGRKVQLILEGILVILLLLTVAGSIIKRHTTTEDSTAAKENTMAEESTTTEAANENHSESETSESVEVSDTSFGDTTGDADADEATIKETVTYLEKESYPVSLIHFYQHYPETRSFVLAYPQYKKDASEVNPIIDISDDVQKGEYPHFLQWDSRWGYRKYGRKIMGITGCGPTCLSMVYCGLTGKIDQNPYSIAKWAENAGYYVEDEGTEWEFMSSGAEHYGLNAVFLDASESKMTDALEKGQPIICSVGAGDFTYAGHFIVLAGMNEDGTINVLDPNSKKNTQRTWTKEELLPQIKCMWAYEKIKK